MKKYILTPFSILLLLRENFVREFSYYAAYFLILNFPFHLISFTVFGQTQTAVAAASPIPIRYQDLHLYYIDLRTK